MPGYRVKPRIFLRVGLFVHLSCPKKGDVRQTGKFFAVPNRKMFYKIYEKQR